ncbi:non-ribosomal peptide synthetase [Paracidovorax wautersii]|uniref:Amino acid adenylation domain-containing protein n=1 Tax=Paracidovorax wautersii TaxID=1177982 RepID=A0A1I2F0Y4_9BURK|nr:non-ribosomal peptide synthetase [Paracidovorax wautersii]SFE98358.1 amino acid adenylation domain-containing protein [Paracidovorax wautersii]
MDRQALAERFARLPREKQRVFLQALSQQGMDFALLPIVPAARACDADGTQRAALSYAQQRQWFLWELDPEASAYHIAGALRLRGRLDADAMQACFDALVARHEALRTVFDTDAAGQVFQRIAPAAPCSFERIDVEPDAGEEQARAAARRLTATPFDLRRGPLLRVGLIRLAPDDHVLVVVMHHIVADGWSKQVLVEELMALYRARVQGTEDAALPALPVRYADYAAWQRHWLEAGEGARQLDYWRRQLGGTSPALQLPSDQSRRADGRYQAAAFDAELPQPLVQALQRRAQASGATLFTLLLAGFQVLLHRHSGESDIRVGVPVANRHRAEVERVVGFFVNMQVLRNAIDGRMPLAQVLAQAREAALGAQAHQDLPFEQLVDALRPERSLSVNPLFQVAFNHERTDGRAFEGLPGLQAEGYALPDPAAQFELVLNTAESHDGRVNATFIYAAELFTAEAMERLSGHYTAILQALAATPELAVGDVALLSVSEQAQLAAWSINPEREPAFEPIHRQIARQSPQATALLFADEVWTYGQLNRRSSQLAHRLRRQGVGPDTLVGIAMQRSPELIVGILAILKAGGAYLPLDPDQPGARLAAMAGGSGIQLLLIHEATRGLVPERAGLQSLDMGELDLNAEPETEPDIPLHGDHLAYVIYTSGSTGQPKGAAIRHQALHSCMAWMQRSYRLQPQAGDTVLHKAPIGFDVSCWEIFWPLSCGARLVLAQPGEQRDPERITQLIRRHQITTLNFVPAMLQAFLAHPGIEEHTRLKHIIVGGEAMPAQTQRQTLQRLKSASLQNLYGPTETTIHVTRWTCRDDGASQVPIGRPISDTQAHILDADLNPVPQGVAGELYIGGVSLARGYLGQAGLTAERFVASPFGQGERLYRTGDLVRWNAEGQIDYLGRLDHQVKIRGLRIELGEVEAQILGQAEVRQAVVVVAAGTLVAYVSAQPGSTVDGDALRERLARLLPDYMVPRAIVVLDVLPLNANGKVDRKALPDASQLLAGSRAFEPPGDEAEAALAALWRELLGVPQVGRRDNFFELGGDSILSLQLLARLRSTPPGGTGATRIALADVMQARDLAALAARWRECSAGGEGRSLPAAPAHGAVCLQPGGAGMPLFCLPGLIVNTREFLPLAQAMAGERPVHAFVSHVYTEQRWRGFAIDTLADEYARCIAAQVGAGGRCALLGWSIGGDLAFAVAQRLQGRVDVRLLAMVDVFEPEPMQPAHALTPAEVDAALRAWVAGSGMQAPWQDLLARMSGSERQWVAEQLRDPAQPLPQRVAAGEPGDDAAELALWATLDSRVRLARHVLPRSAQPLHVFQAEQSLRMASPGLRDWSRHAPVGMAEVVPGAGHLDVIRHPALCEALRRHLQEADR